MIHHASLGPEASPDSPAKKRLVAQKPQQGQGLRKDSMSGTARTNSSTAIRLARTATIKRLFMVGNLQAIPIPSGLRVHSSCRFFNAAASPNSGGGTADRR